MQPEGGLKRTAGEDGAVGDGVGEGDGFAFSDKADFVLADDESGAKSCERRLLMAAVACKTARNNQCWP